MMQTVLGHDDVMARFAHLMRDKHLPHAWLLHGLSGVGKGLLAVQLAAMYLCESVGDNGKACGACHSCHMLAVESHPDFMATGILWDEKKKKFHRDISVDQVREALSFLSLSGMESSRRVLLIDDADAMNGQAANALLKGLEEPNEGSLMLLVCDDITRLPVTIVSRCMLAHCAPLQAEDMKEVCLAMGFSDDVLDLVQSIAMGCPGQVQALQDADVAKACLQWQALCADIQRADIGEINAWLNQHVNSIPHDLIVSILALPLETNLQHLDANQVSKQMVFDAFASLLAWPAEVVRHGLRPAPALLARILEMRRVLKEAVML